MKENWKMVLFWIFIILLIPVLIFSKNEKEGWMPLIAFVASLGTMVFMVIFDRWRHPEIYRKKKQNR